MRLTSKAAISYRPKGRPMILSLTAICVAGTVGLIMAVLSRRPCTTDLIGLALAPPSHRVSSCSYLHLRVQQSGLMLPPSAPASAPRRQLVPLEAAFGH